MSPFLLLLSTVSVLVSVYFAASSSSPLATPSLALLAFVLLSYLVLKQIVAQYVQKHGEPPLYSGWIPYVGLAIEFGTDHASLLRRLADSSGDAPAFTAYIAGQRMTFVKNPIHFNSVLREGKKRLQFRPVAEKIMKEAFQLGIDTKSAAYELWEEDSPKQWAMLRGEPLLRLMAQTQQELIQALQDQEQSSTAALAATAATASDGSAWHDIDDLYDVVVDLMWQATGKSFFGQMFDDDNQKMTQAKNDFRTFDENFPLLAGGIPSLILPGMFEDSLLVAVEFSIVTMPVPPIEQY